MIGLKVDQGFAKSAIKAFCVLVVLSILGPPVIWGLHSVEDGLPVPWTPEVMLGYFGSVLSCFAAGFIGLVTLRQNDVIDKMNGERELELRRINEQLLHTLKCSSLGYFTLDLRVVMKNHVKVLACDLSKPLIFRNQSSNLIRLISAASVIDGAQAMLFKNGTAVFLGDGGQQSVYKRKLRIEEKSLSTPLDVSIILELQTLSGYSYLQQIDLRLEQMGSLYEVKGINYSMEFLSLREDLEQWLTRRSDGRGFYLSKDPVGM